MNTPVITERYCENCKEWHPLSEWLGNDDTPSEWDYEVYCEDCGSHYARKCLKCKELTDIIWEQTR